MDDDLVKRLARFERRYFPKYREEYRRLAAGVADGAVFLHGWHYVIEDGRVLVLDVASGEFVATDVAMGDADKGGDAASCQLQ